MGAAMGANPGGGLGASIATGSQGCGPAARASGVVKASGSDRWGILPHAFHPSLAGTCPSSGGSQLLKPSEGLGIHPLRQGDRLGPVGQGIAVITAGLDPAGALQLPADGPSRARKVPVGLAAGL